MAKTAESRTQKDMVTELLESGILSPTEIVSAAKEKFGAEIPKANVNQIKVQWKKAKNATGRKVQIKRSPAVAKPSEDGSQVTAATGPSELEVAKFALRLGGVEKAIRALQNLMK